jgi:hypothetical protein
MKNKKLNIEIQLLVVAVLCAVVLIFGHFILNKSLSNKIWIEYTAAAIPFVLFIIGVFSIIYAKGND